ncbi:MAG TPA: hypothetical protein PKJ26_04325 [Candidatus Woesebacteria bacterium]|nr:hypothetical protein [Candidatus Woesebacteria bacterium]
MSEDNRLTHYSLKDFERALGVAVATGKMHQDTALEHRKTVRALYEAGQNEAAEEYILKTPKKIGYKDREGWHQDKE